MIKNCIICGNEFEPRYNLINKQMCCSRECSIKHRREYQADRYQNDIAFRRKSIAYSRKYNAEKKHPTLCKICGKPVEKPDYMPTSKPQMHDYCVFEDCAETIESNKELTKAQIQRLAARGYTLREFMEEYMEMPFTGRRKSIDWQHVETGLLCLN